MESLPNAQISLGPPPPDSRADLLRLLAEACELEHGLACAYLYAAFSLKQDASEGGLTPLQVLLVRQWAGQIFFVAAQEMLHLAQAWNLLVAAGGAPYYLRPNFPQSSKYYPLHLPLELTPFSVETISRFIAYEKPAQVCRPKHQETLAKLPTPPAGKPVPYHSIAQLYAQIHNGFEKLPNIFVADPARQTGPDSADFPDLIRVIDLATSRAAIARILLQGEGLADDREDCHFGIFVKIAELLLEAQHDDKKFAPARAAACNPTVLDISSSGAPNGKPITNEFSREVAELFDELYSLVVQMLAYAFSASGRTAQQLAKEAIRLMPTAIKPLGETLMLLPMTAGSDSLRAGPGFGLTREVPFPDDAGVAVRIACERLLELAKNSDELVDEPEAHKHPQTQKHLTELGGRLRLAEATIKASL